MIIIIFHHTTVLLNEAVNELNIKPSGTYVDATLGGGGHTNAILSYLTTGHLYSFDQDITAVKYNNERFAKQIADGKLTIIDDNFRNLQDALSKYDVTHIDGIVYDLGVSSPQFDDAQRGFSYKLEAPLDMRMNQQQALTAYQVVNEWSYQDLVRILTRYSDERFAKQIARKIERTRAIAPIATTTQLAELVKSAIPAAARRTGGHPAKKTFQAIRIAVNDELGALEDSLTQAIQLLNPQGRIAVITFQPKEDHLVQSILKTNSRINDIPRGLPVIPAGLQPPLKLITHKPILPSEAELAHNHRAHSAKLRVAQKN